MEIVNISPPMKHVLMYHLNQPQELVGYHRDFWAEAIVGNWDP